MQLILRFGSRSTWRALVAVTGVLAAGHIAQMMLGLGVGWESPVLKLLDLNEERSIGTVFSVGLFLASAALLTIIALAARRRGGAEARETPWWLGLAILFVFLAIDDAEGIHEALIVPVRTTLHTSGMLYFAWVVPYAGLVVAVALIYVRFLWRLPRGIALRIVIAGAIFVAAAAGMDLLAGWMQETRRLGPRSLPMELEYLVEETFEAIGIAYFLTALLRLIERNGDSLQLVIALPDSTPHEQQRPPDDLGGSR